MSKQKIRVLAKPVAMRPYYYYDTTFKAGILTDMIPQLNAVMPGYQLELVSSGNASLASQWLDKPFSAFFEYGGGPTLPNQPKLISTALATE